MSLPPGKPKQTIPESPQHGRDGDWQDNAVDYLDVEWDNRSQPNAARLAADRAKDEAAVHVLPYAEQSRVYGAGSADDDSDGE
jgi:hypothetical protein